MFGASAGLGTLAYRLSSQIYFAMNDENSKTIKQLPPRKNGKFTKKDTSLISTLSSQKLKECKTEAQGKLLFDDRYRKNKTAICTYFFNTFYK